MLKRPRLTNEELKNLPEQCFPFNTGGAVIIDKETLRMICNELITKRENQEKLVNLLEQADKYSEKLEWKLLFRDLPDIIETVIKKHDESEKV